MWSHWRSVLLGALLIGVWGPCAVLAQEIPAKLRGTIFLRAVAYERTFSDDPGHAFLAVVGPPEDSGAEHADEMAQTFADLAARMRVADRRLRVLRVTARSAGDAAERLADRGVEVVYIAAPTQAAQAELAQAMGRQGALVLCRKMAPGCMVAVEAADDRPRLVVDVGRAKAGGRRFDGRVLRLARVVR